MENGKPEVQTCKPEVETLIVKKIYDDIADVSWIGEFTDNWQEGAIDLKEIGEHYGGDYLYFVSCNHGVYKPGNWDHVKQETKNELIAKHGSLQAVEEHYAMQDYERMKDFQNGNFVLIGIRAECTVKYKCPNHPGSYRIETFTSAGLWGIESDSGDDYLNDVAKEQIADLKIHLNCFGVDTSGIEELTPDAIEEFELADITEN